MPLSELNLKPADISLSDLFEDDLELTSPPTLFFELKRVIEDPSKSLAEAGHIIIHDPSLTMRLLKLVNSAYFGFPERIVKVTQAISLIGSKELQNFVLATLIVDKFSAQPEGMMTMAEFWAASVRSALMAKSLAQAVPSQLPAERESVFICGLLHDIGKLVFYRRIPEIARQVDLLAGQNNEADFEIERRLLGFDHYDAGAELARLWQLPSLIAETIGQHAKPNPENPHGRIADLVRSANLASKLELPEAVLGFQDWGLSDEALSRMLDEVQEQFYEVFSIFYPAL
jgi:putative nucleotidyltransferase with HDIG domain